MNHPDIPARLLTDDGRTLCSDPIPVDPTVADLIAMKQRLLAEHAEKLNSYLADGWALASTAEITNVLDGTYRKLEILTRPQSSASEAAASGDRIGRYQVPVDPMDDLQCDSCQ